MAAIRVPADASQAPLPPRTGDRVSHEGLPRLVIALALLDGFVGLTAACGAVFVVPALPSDLLRFDYFFGLEGPAVALGLLAAISLAGLYGLLTRRPAGAFLSILAGVALVVFELVESWVVGNLFCPPPGVTGSGDAALWLQPFYVAFGLAMVLLGGRAAPIAANRSPGHVPRAASFPTTATAIILATLSVAAGCIYGWAGASTGTSMWARFIAWTRFPSRPLPPAASPDIFLQTPQQVDLTQATGSTNPDHFFSSSQTTALLVLQHGRLVLERYYNGASRSTMITSFSVSKSWDSAMVGAAIAAGYIHSVDDPVTAYIPELARKDPRFASITLRDLLDMRSGLAWDTGGFIENDDSVVYNTTTLRQAVLSRLRIAGSPGHTFRYNDFNPLLLGMVIERATGRTVTRWLDQTLWDPLGAQYSGSFSLDSEAGGFEKMESGLNGRPIDLLRLGVLYLHNGIWHGRQLIPRQWVTQSTRYDLAGAARFPGVRYGLGWWTRVIDGTRVYYAWGDHGEYILVAPSLDIVVARFGREYGFDAPRGDSSGGSVGVQTWPTVLTRIAVAVAATRS